MHHTLSITLLICQVKSLVVGRRVGKDFCYVNYEFKKYSELNYRLVAIIRFANKFDGNVA